MRHMMRCELMQRNLLMRRHFCHCISWTIETNVPSHLDFSQGCTAIDYLSHCGACVCGYMRPPSKGWFDLTYRIVHDRLAEEALCDGIFPLITNERAMSERELLLAYKQQPRIETRFAQLKTDFVVAPVYLKETSRIQALLCVYFFALLVEALLERELRRAMEGAGIESLPLYPEGRACRRPTARRMIDVFEDVHKHDLTEGRRPAVVFSTELTRLQRKILRLLGMPKAYDI